MSSPPPPYEDIVRSLLSTLEQCQLLLSQVQSDISYLERERDAAINDPDTFLHKLETVR